MVSVICDFPVEEVEQRIMIRFEIMSGFHKRLDLRSKHEMFPRMVRIIQGLHPEPVPGNENGTGFPVVDGESPHAVEPV